MLVLGIDPGIERTGYGFIQANNRELKPISYGLISTSKNDPKTERFLQIYQDMKSLIEKHHPEYMSIESLIFAKNVTTAFTVSEVRGIFLLLSAQYRLPVYEFTPIQVKMAVTGYGRSGKPQVENAVKLILGLSEIPKPDDVSDALAIGITGANHIAFHNKLV